MFDLEYEALAQNSKYEQQMLSRDLDLDDHDELDAADYYEPYDFSEESNDFYDESDYGESKNADKLKTYSWDETAQTLTVFSNTGVKDFCYENDVLTSSYDYKTVIDPSVKDCSHLFSYSRDEVLHGTYDGQPFVKFNQSLVIPDGVTDVSYMLEKCELYNQLTVFPDSVENLTGALACCKSLNSPVILSKNAKCCNLTLLGCESLNQSVAVPDGAKIKVQMFEGCNYLRDDGSVKTYSELSNETKEAVTNSLAEKAVQKSYLKQDVELSSQESELVQIYKKQKALRNSLGSEIDVMKYERDNPDVFREYNAYSAAISKVKAEHGIQNDAKRVVAAKESDRELGG